jgi:hypothetical protein
MDDSRRVRLGESLGGLRGNVQDPPDRHRARERQLAQSLPLHELHGDVRDAIGLPDFVDRDDVGVVQGRRRARLLLEPGETVGIG